MMCLGGIGESRRAALCVFRAGTFSFVSCSLTCILTSVLFLQYVLAEETPFSEDPVEVCCYGRLEFILDFELAADPALGLKKKRRFLLAGITACRTEKRDGAMEAVSYDKMDLSAHVIDLNAVRCVVGRVRISF